MTTPLPPAPPASAVARTLDWIRANRLAAGLAAAGALVFLLFAVAMLIVPAPRTVEPASIGLTAAQVDDQTRAAIAAQNGDDRPQMGGLHTCSDAFADGSAVQNDVIDLACLDDETTALPQTCGDTYWLLVDTMVGSGSPRSEAVAYFKPQYEECHEYLSIG